VRGVETATLDEALGVARQEGTDLLVVAGGGSKTAARLMMLAPCPVLVMPAGAELKPGPVLIPVDFSEHSRKALAHGEALAGRWGRESICMFVETEDAPWHVQRDEKVEHERKLAALREFAPYSNRHISEPLERSAEALGAMGLSFAHSIEGADVAWTIARVAAREGCSITVMGTRGRTASAAVLLGSVAEHLALYGTRPVLAVKTGEHNLGVLDLLLGEE